MATETELKLSLPARAARRLAAHPLLAGIAPLKQRLLNTYYDTPDLQLQRERVAVRYRRKGRDWLLTVKSAAPASGGLARRSEWETPGLPGEFDFSHVDDGALRHRLEALRPALTPAFSTDFTRSAWILQPDADTRIELALDRGWIAHGERREPICEIELELLAGNVVALFDAALALQQDLPLHPESVSKAERGYRLYADTAPSPVKARVPTLPSDSGTIDAFRRITLECLQHLQGNEQGARLSSDPEFVHQARVAIRRLRSALKIWAPLLPPAFVDAFGGRWQTLAQQLGEARNWDVLASETLPPLACVFPHHRRIARLVRQAERQQARCRKAVRAAFGDAAYSRLLLEFTAALLALTEPHRGETLASFARTCLKQRMKRTRQRAKPALDTDPAARHRLRVAVKQLRYTLEFFAGPLASGRLRRSLAAASELQTLLGTLNDLTVARGLLDSLPGGCPKLAAGWLAGREETPLRQLGCALESLGRQPKPWTRG